MCMSMHVRMCAHARAFTDMVEEAEVQECNFKVECYQCESEYQTHPLLRNWKDKK